LAIVATIGASAAAGGLVFMSFAKYLKYSMIPIASTWSRTAVFMSKLSSTSFASGL
jgi:hypothetical protein